MLSDVMFSSDEERHTRARVELAFAVFAVIAVEVRLPQVDGPVDEVEDDERQREDASRHPVNVLRRAEPAAAAGVRHREPPDAVRLLRRRWVY